MSDAPEAEADTIKLLDQSDFYSSLRKALNVNV